MQNSYIEKKLLKARRKEERDNFIFGLAFGFGMILIFTFQLLYSPTVKFDTLFMILIGYGVLCVLLATLNPNFKLLKWIKKFNTSIFNFIGNCLLKLILALTYFIFVVPVGIYMRSKKIKDINTNFIDYSNSYNMKLGKYGFLKILRLFTSDYFYMLPLIIILIILSVLVILMTSSVITPFIYPLF